MQQYQKLKTEFQGFDKDLDSFSFGFQQNQLMGTREESNEEESISEQVSKIQPKSSLKSISFDKNWTCDDQEKLIQLHKKFGNRWTQIAQNYPGMCENSIKNRFYSRLRKSVRKLNKAIGGKDLKRYNKFKLNIIFKLSNISEGKMAQKHKFAPQIFQFYREFLYKLIEFSNQDQKQTLTKQLIINIDDVENLILPLVALENLFRLVRGERVAKGKKKNIAYLRQFSFKLSLQSLVHMIITKENILLVNDNKEFLEQLDQKLIVHEKDKVASRQKNSMGRETPKKDQQGYQKQKVPQSENWLDFECSQYSSNSSPTLFKDQEQLDCRTQSELWRDYNGDEMKEYDIFTEKKINPELDTAFGFYSFKSCSFIDDNNIW